MDNGCFPQGLSNYRTLEIENISVHEEDGCTIRFTDGSEITIFDEGQSCCETRWMTCDDELKEHIGGHLTGVEVLEGLKLMESEDEYECIFVRIETNAGSFTLCMHNKHNGYYGGFSPGIKK